jgi:hypothetical protein
VTIVCKEFPGEPVGVEIDGYVEAIPVKKIEITAVGNLRADHATSSSFAHKWRSLGR